MQISFIGSPSKIDLDNENVKLNAQKIAKKMGNNVGVIDVANIKVAKIIILILNWNQAKNNTKILSVLHKSSDKIPLQKLFEQLKIQEIEKIPSTLIFHHKIFRQFTDAITEQELNDVLKEESSIDVEVSEMQQNKAPKILEQIKVRKPTNKSKIMVCIGNSMSTILLAVQLNNKPQSSSNKKEQSPSPPKSKTFQVYNPLWFKIVMILICLAISSLIISQIFDKGQDDQSNSTINKALAQVKNEIICEKTIKKPNKQNKNTKDKSQTSKSKTIEGQTKNSKQKINQNTKSTPKTPSQTKPSSSKNNQKTNKNKDNKQGKQKSKSNKKGNKVGKQQKDVKKKK